MLELSMIGLGQTATAFRLGAKTVDLMESPQTRR